MSSRRRLFGATAVVLALGLATPAVSGASAPAATHVGSQPPALRASLHQARSALRVYRLAVREIRREFAAAIASAKAQLRSSLAAATTPGQRFTARAQFRLALAQAIAARDAALVKLGPAPPA